MAGAFWSGSVADFLAIEPRALIERLTHVQVHHHPEFQRQQLRAWDMQIALLRGALRQLPDLEAPRLLLEYPLIRLGRRIDAVLLLPRVVVVLEFKDKDGFDAADERQAEDYALDLHDFHVGSRANPIVPVLVTSVATVAPQTAPLLLPGVVTLPMLANAASLPGLLRSLHDAAMLAPLINGADWERAAYRPVPSIVEAARMLYGRHGVAEIAAARADVTNLGRTTQAILDAVAQAEAERHFVVVFVTGIPGAGKTLCGLNVAFARGSGSASFLTGNPTLVHVFREALARDAAGSERGQLRLARQRMRGAIQPLPQVRDHYVRAAQEIPAEHIIVIDEAQRCWSRDHAIRKSRDRPIRLEDSEPALLLDMMARHADWAALVCLVGQGQEIHTGEGGMAEWGEALRTRGNWRICAAPDLLNAADPLQRLPALPGLHTEPALHLTVPVRSIRSDSSTAWVEAVLRFDRAEATRIAASGHLPFRLTRSLDTMRQYLRGQARGERRCGLVGSAGAARLRADGLGAELPHMDEGAVAHWFLDHFPDDVRASDALEQVATEFSCQGLELDYVGMCWGGDMVPVGTNWQPRQFRGTDWQTIRATEARAYQINTYRVLLSRARYETVIWVPAGDAIDRTRHPAQFDAIAEFLLSCGARSLQTTPPATASHARESRLLPAP